MWCILHLVHLLLGSFFFLFLVQHGLVGEDEVVHYNKNLRSCGAHVHSRFTAILPGLLGSSNDVQRSVWGFNASEYEVMVSDYLTFKSPSCYFCNKQIIAVSYLRSKNKVCLFWWSIIIFPKPHKSDLRFRDINNVQIRLICFPFQLCKYYLCWDFFNIIKERSCVSCLKCPLNC